MKINVNMSAVITNKQLMRTERNLQASIERLSSGYKINRAGDNPAGIAISNKMRAQIDALDKAQANATDAVSVMQIADGALSEVTSILQRIRELSVQAANGTNTYEDRQSIQMEINTLVDEVNRVSTDTEYNTKNLLDGSSNVRSYTEPKAATRLDVSDGVMTGTYALNVEKAALQATTSLTLPSSFTDGTLNINGVEMKVTSDMTQEQFLEEMRTVVEEADCTAEWDITAGTFSLTANRYGTRGEVKVSATGALANQLGVTAPDTTSETPATISYNKETQMYERLVTGKDAVASIPTNYEDAGFTSTATVTTDGNRVTVSDFNGFSIDFLLDSDYEIQAGADAATAASEGNFSIEVTDIGAMTIQIGGNQYQTMKVRIPEISAETLYLDTVDVTVQNGAKFALETLDQALEKVTATRSDIGAFQNRLEYAQGSLSETHEDITAAYSALVDTDMAQEMAEYTQQNILDQAAISVLSQANDLPEKVLSMLQ